MNFDEILAFIFGKRGLCLLLIVVLAALIFATACDISDFCTAEDVDKVCAGWDENDCLMLVLCGCVNPEYLCNFAECACDKACDGVSTCTDSCHESLRNCITGACDSCLGMCGTSVEGQTDCMLDCYSDCFSCLFCIDTSRKCPGCGEKIDSEEILEYGQAKFCPYCFYNLGSS